MSVQQVVLQHILSTVPVVPAQSLHVAIITDGNGRWATSRGLPRSAGHRAGAEAARSVIQAAPRLGIHTLTLFALSSANWKRPTHEVNAILRLLHEYLLAETAHCVDEGVRLSVIGRRDRIPATLREAIADAEALTAKGTQLSPETFSNVLSEVLHGGSTEVDLLIRTGGEQRLSDFLLWECAFAEFVFMQKRWPEFTVADLVSAVREFHQRERTRGGLPNEAPR
jgi:undecaprenyl diphosphate synthase